MHKLPCIAALTVLLASMAIRARPALADRVSCGPGGECFAASQGFSASCECKIRVVNGATICKPSGICDPHDATSCDSNQFPPGIASHAQVSSRFLNDLAQVNPLLAGATWAGIAEANSSNADRAEVKGTMGREGRSYTYRAQVQLLADGSVSLKVHVQEDGAQRGQDYEGSVASDGRTGRFAQVGAKGKSPVFSWDAR